MKPRLTSRQVLKYSLLGGILGPVIVGGPAVGLFVSAGYHASAREMLAFLVLTYFGAVVELLFWYIVRGFD